MLYTVDPRSHEAVRPLRLSGDPVLGVWPRAAPYSLHQAARHPHHDVIRPVQEVGKNILCSAEKIFPYLDNFM